MVQIITPSTGAVREAPSINMNVLRIKPGERALFRADFRGWDVAEVGAIGEAGVTLTRDGRFHCSATWRDIAGIVAPDADEEALVENLRALEKRGDAMIADARKTKMDGLRAVLDVTLARANSFIPGVSL